MGGAPVSKGRSVRLLVEAGHGETGNDLNRLPRTGGDPMIHFMNISRRKFLGAAGAATAITTIILYQYIGFTEITVAATIPGPDLHQQAGIIIAGQG